MLFSSWEFKFIELSDAFSRPSIMPQKKNPDIAELVRGKTGRVLRRLVTSATLLKGLPLAYNKDMQEDKEAIFDALDTAKACLSVIASHAGNDDRPSTETSARPPRKALSMPRTCADYLVKKGMPFRTAYQITGRSWRTALQKANARNVAACGIPDVFRLVRKRRLRRGRPRRLRENKNFARGASPNRLRTRSKH